MSKFLFGVFVVAAQLCMFIQATSAEIIVSEKVKRDIQSALLKPLPVYELDKEQEKILVRRLDYWMEKQFDSAKVKKVKKKKKDITIWRQTSKTNRPLPAAPGEKSVKPLRINAPFSVFYESEPRRWTFFKEIEVLAVQELPKETVINLGRKFIEKNGFYLSGHAESLAKPQVISRMRNKIPTQPGEKEEIYVLAQSVVFRRRIEGYPVHNSKQIVDIHPQSREVLGFHHNEWVPVKNKPAKNSPLVSGNEIIKRLEAKFPNATKPYRAEKAELAYYQTTRHLIPVLLVRARSSAGNRKKSTQPWQHVLLLSLVKNIKLERSAGEIFRPRNPF